MYLLDRKPEFDDNEDSQEESWADEVLDALPLSENLNTNQLIVTNTNQVLQPIMYEYVSDEDFDNTQGVVSLNVNGARVLNTFTNPTSIQSNGLHEFDVVDSNVNMPILNYKVNVALPIYEPPNDYTAKRIVNGQINTTLDYFVNADLTNYSFIPKNLPVIIDVSPSVNSVFKINIGGNTICSSSVNGYWNYRHNSGDISVSSNNEVVVISDMSYGNFRISYYYNSSSSTIYVPNYSWIYSYDRTLSSEDNCSFLASEVYI